MFRNVHYDKRNSIIHLWETVNKERIYKKIPWVPYVYFKDESIKNPDTYSIFDEPVKKIKFKTYTEYKNFTEGKTIFYENNVKPEIQFLAERYYNIPDDSIEIPEIRIQFCDIEVYSTKGFPYPSNAIFPITLISVYDSFLNKIYTFGYNEYTGENLKEPWFVYVKCENEKDLLIKFFQFMKKNTPDVWSGWNVYNFDLPYIINRCKSIWGEKDAYKFYSMMSPINIVTMWEKTDGTLNCDIAGVSIVDYLPLYKTYSRTLLRFNLESYRLDFVAKHELDKGKLDYSESYLNLNDLYIQNFNMYVDYNIIDVKRVKQIDEKRKFIRQAQLLSILTKCPIKLYEKVTSLIEAIFLVYYRRNNLCAPIFKGGPKEPFVAAYVKVPIPGLYFWVIDVDIESSYPHQMITLNMGNETYFGTIIKFDTELFDYWDKKDEWMEKSGFTKEDLSHQNHMNLVMTCSKIKLFPPFLLEKENGKLIKMFEEKLEKFQTAFNRGLYCIAPNGSLFNTIKKGAIAEIERYVFNMRKRTKSKMIETKKLAENDPSLKNKVDELNAMQTAFKLLINSIFGAISVPYYRGYNLRIAEAITAGGQWSVRSGEKYTNKIMNNVDQYPEIVSILNELREKEI